MIRAIALTVLKRMKMKKASKPGDKLMAFKKKVEKHEAKEKKTGKPAKALFKKGKKK